MWLIWILDDARPSINFAFNGSQSPLANNSRQERLMKYTRLDAAKQAIEYSLRMFQKRSNNVNEVNYALFSTAADSCLLSSSLIDSPTEFHDKLKAITFRETKKPDAIAGCLKQVFEYLHIHNLNQFETLGFGCYPSLSQQAIILFVGVNGFMPSLNLPGLKVPGCEFYQEPFRWSQRLFTLLLEPSSVAVAPDAAEENEATVKNWMEKMCAVTGGHLCSVSSIFQVRRFIETLFGMMSKRLPVPPIPLPPSLLSTPCVYPPGVLVRFHQYTSATNPATKTGDSFLGLLYVEEFPFTKFKQVKSNLMEYGWAPYLEDPLYRKFGGYWPIPETARCALTVESKAIVPRQASHPQVWVDLKPSVDWSLKIPDGIQFRKYMFEERSCGPIHQAAMIHSFSTFLLYTDAPDGTEGKPFAFFKVNTNRTGVNMWILPYNFPLLFALVNSMRDMDLQQVGVYWSLYLSSTPAYYHHVVRKMLLGLKIDDCYERELRLDSKQFHHRSSRALQNMKKVRILAAEALEGIHDRCKSAVNSPVTDRMENVAFNIDRDRLLDEYTKRLGFVFPEMKPICRSLSAPFESTFETEKAADVEALLANWNFSPISKSNFLPRTESQQLQDLNHAVPVEQMVDYRPHTTASDRFRFATDEEEMRDEMLAFGNPYKLIGKEIVKRQAHKLDLNITDDDGNAFRVVKQRSSKTGNRATSLKIPSLSERKVVSEVRQWRNVALSKFGAMDTSKDVAVDATVFSSLKNFHRTHHDSQANDINYSGQVVMTDDNFSMNEDHVLTANDNWMDEAVDNADPVDRDLARTPEMFGNPDFEAPQRDTVMTGLVPASANGSDEESDAPTSMDVASDEDFTFHDALTRAIVVKGGRILESVQIE